MAWNKNSWYGQSILAWIAAKIGWPIGNVYFVANSSNTDEANYQHMQDIFTPDNDGKARFYTSLATAYAATESNNNDVIILDGNSTHTLTAELNVSKNRVHFVGMDYLLGIHRKQGQSAKINIGVTTATGDVSAILNTWVRNSFRGLKISNSNTLTQALYAFADGWEFTYMEDCEVVYLAKLSTATVADLACNADTWMYVNCSFWSTANEITANWTRPNVLLSWSSVAAWKKARDVRFEKCDFLYKAGDVDNTFVYGVNATDVERLMVFDGCLFYNNLLAAQTMTLWMILGATQTEGSIIVKDSAAYNTTDFATAVWIFQACNAANAANWIEATQSA